MSKRTRHRAIWSAVYSAIDNCLDHLTNSAQRLTLKGLRFTVDLSKWMWMEPLESRMYLTGIPHIAGPLHAFSYYPYTLNLVGNNTGSWHINWGDGINGTADVTNVSSTATFATHTFTSTPQSVSITATNSWGPVVDALGLNVTYGTNGYVNTGGDHGARALAIEPNGQVVALIYGTSGFTGGVHGFALERFNLDGSLDTTFGNSGFATLTNTAGYSSWSTIAINGDGDIAVGGSYQASGGVYGGYLLADVFVPGTGGGSFQSSFKSQEFANVRPSSGYGIYATDIAYVNNEIAVVGGDSESDSSSYAADLVVFNPPSGGPWQAQFPESGSGSHGSFTSYEYEKVTIDPGDGNVFMTRRRYYSGYYNSNYGGFEGYGYSFPVVDEYQWSGSGKLKYDFAIPEVNDPVIALQSSGKVLLGGVNLEQFLANGSRDLTFGDGGYEPIASNFYRVSQIVPLADDYSLVLGKDVSGDDVLAYYKPDGSLEGSFGAGGILRGVNASTSSNVQVAQLSDGDFEIASIDGDGQIDISQIYNSSTLQISPSVVVDPIPNATIGNPLTINGTVYSFESPSDELAYQWSIKDNGTSVTLPNDGISTSPQITFTPNSTGNNWSVGLTVTDETLSSGSTTVSTTATSTFTVGPQPFQVSGPETATAGDALDYVVSGPGASTAFWIVNNGSTTVENATGSTLSFVPAQGGSYVVEAATLNGTNALTSSVSLDVADAPLTVTINGSSVAFQGRPIVLTSTVSQPSGVSDSFTYLWEIAAPPTGGGSAVLLESDNGTPLDTGSLSTYLTPASFDASSTLYTAILTVTNSTGQSVTKEFPFQVLADPGESDYEKGFLPVYAYVDSGGETKTQAEVNSYAVAQEPDGKILVAGTAENLLSNNDGTYQAFVARFNSDLTLDTNFGSSLGYAGVITNAFSDVDTEHEFSSTTITSITVNTANGNIVFAGIGALPNGNNATLVDEITSNGGIDLDFNSDNQNEPWCSAGVFVPASFNAVTSTYTAAYWDTTGQVGTGWSEIPYDVVALPNDSILVGGARSQFWNDAISSDGQDYEDDFLLAELTNGSLDPNFGNAGYAYSVNPLRLTNSLNTWDKLGSTSPIVSESREVTGWLNWLPPGATAYISKIVPQFNSDGSLADVLVGGSALDWANTSSITGIIDGSPEYDGTGFDFVLARYLPDGQVDSSFGTDGMAVSSFTKVEEYDDDFLSSFEILPSGAYEGDILEAGAVPSPTEAGVSGTVDELGAVSYFQPQNLGLALFTENGLSVTDAYTNGQTIVPIDVGGDLAPKNESSRNVRISAISKGARTC
jgi:uncharacterized delta-60 repeat protein